MKKTTRILVVDDDPVVLQVVSLILRSEGYEVWEASSGTEGLQVTRERRPGLLLLDVNLPDLSGIEVCRQIKADPALSDVFVVLISGEATGALNKVGGFEVGADEYLTKPIEGPELLARIRTLLRLRNALAAHKAGEGALRVFLDAIGEPAMMVDRTGTVLVGNQSMARTLGHSVDNITGRHAFDLFPPDIARTRKTQFDEVVRTGQPMQFEDAHGNRHFLNYLKPVLDAEGEVSRVALFALDITGRKRAEQEIFLLSETLEQRVRERTLQLEAATEALRESEKQLRLALDGSNAGTWSWDTRTNLSRWDERFHALYGFSRHEPISFEAWIGRVHPDDRARLLVQIQTMVEPGGENSWNEEFRVLHPTEGLRWMTGVGHVERDEAGRATRFIGINLDTTERKRAEAQLRVQSAALEAAANGVVLTDQNGVILWANPAFTRMTGYSLEEAIGRKPSFLKSGQHDAAFYHEMWATILRGEVWQGELVNRRKDGSLYPEEMTITPVPDDHGGIGHFIAIEQDITARKQAGIILRENEEKFRALFESAPIGIALHFANGRIIETNRRYEQMMGYSAEELRKLGVKRITYPDDVAEGQRMYSELCAGKRDRYHREKRYLHKDGHLIWGQSSVSAIRNPSGELMYLISMVEDITQSKETLELLRESERNLRLIAENTTDVIFAFDMNRRPTYVNSAVEELTGYTFAEIAQKGFINRIHPADQERMLRHWEESYAGKGYSDIEFRLITKAGETKWCSSTCGPLFDESGRQIGVQGREQDITGRKLAEEELRRLPQRINEAQEAERLRVARELHDGVNQLLASAKMRLRKVEETIGVTAPAAREIVARCSRLLVQALEENRRIAHDLRPTDLDDLGLAAACKNFCKEFQARSTLAVKSRVPRKWTRLPPAVELNLFRIVQEAFNNVAKHAHAKTVRLQLAIEAGVVLLRIRDDGAGFDSNAVTPAKKQRRGIGLTNMRERAAAAGGTCEVVSGPKQGTTITVRVPWRNAK